jgi:prepilin-type N-terminal cleavage/methylation domain-containing protein
MELIRSQKGFTMLEVILSVAISGIVLISIVGTNVLVQKNNDSTHQRIVALQDAHQVVERIRDSASNGLFPNNVYTAFPNGQQVGGFANLTNEQVFVQYTANGTADLLDVTVTVSWMNENNRNSTYSLSTLLAQRE